MSRRRLIWNLVVLTLIVANSIGKFVQGDGWLWTLGMINGIALVAIAFNLIDYWPTRGQAPKEQP